MKTASPPQLEKKTIQELKQICRERFIKGYSGLNKKELINLIKKSFSSKKMKGGNNLESKEELKLLILDKNSSKEDYKNFIIQYKENSKNLCVDEKGHKILDLLDLINENLSYFNNFKNFFKKRKIYYYTKNKQIMAFCLTYEEIEEDTEYKIITASVLCSSIENIKIKNNSLGKHLLNIIYDTYVNKQKYLMLLQPETDELISYYKEWKNPSYDNLSKTSGYLVYGDLKSASENTLIKLNKIFHAYNYYLL